MPVNFDSCHSKNSQSTTYRRRTSDTAWWTAYKTFGSRFQTFSIKTSVAVVRTPQFEWKSDEERALYHKSVNEMLQVYFFQN